MRHNIYIYILFLFEFEEMVGNVFNLLQANNNGTFICLVLLLETRIKISLPLALHAGELPLLKVI